MNPWMSTFPLLGINIVEQRTSDGQITVSIILAIILFIVCLLGTIFTIGFLFHQVYVFASLYGEQIPNEYLDEIMTQE